jgi:hypothetical protein
MKEKSTISTQLCKDLSLVCFSNYSNSGLSWWLAEEELSATD